MSEETPRGTKGQLAIALAQGCSITAWARDNNVPRPTVYRWAKEPEVRKAKEECRRRILDRAVGMMIKRVPWAVPKLIVLAADAESEFVRLQAIKTLVKDMMAVSKFSGLEERMTQIERKLDERDRMAGQAG
jgi:hypothetical protein